MVSLQDNVVIITGASSGIGKAAAIALAQKGASVVLAARRVDKLQALRDHIISLPAECLVVQTDVTSEQQVGTLFEETMSRFGRVDILLNNAGRGLKTDIRATSLDEWRAVLDTNLTSVFLCSREALKRMIPEKSGHIITVGSIAGLYGLGGYAAYCAAKHGVTGFQRSLKWEARPHGIKVSTIFPGRVDTEFFDVYPERPPRGQMLSPEDVADYIVVVAQRQRLKRHLVRALNIGKRMRNFLQ